MSNEKHTRWKFNDDSNDIGTDRIVHHKENKEVLDNVDKMPYCDLEHQKHRKED